MTKKTILIFFITVIVVLFRNYTFEKNVFVASPKKYDTLTTNVARIIENKPVDLYCKKNISSTKIAQITPGDTVVISSITEDWCKISYKNLAGYSQAKILSSYSSPDGTAKWKIWLKHNYKADRWNFWVLNIGLLVILIGLYPVFSAFDKTVLDLKGNTVSKHSRNKVSQFFLESLVPDFRSFYKCCIIGGALILGVAIFDNNAYLSMVEFKLPYLIHGLNTSGTALFAIVTFLLVSLFLEMAGSVLFFGNLFGSIRSIALLIACPIIIVITIALVLPVLMVLTAGIVLKGFSKVNAGSSTPKPGSTFEVTHLRTCPSCGGSGKMGDGLFGGCGTCCGQGKVKYNSIGQMKGPIWG
jgi:hypothetical protein